MTTAPDQISVSGRRRRRVRAPKFTLAIPSWLWYLGFFLVPLLWIVWYSFGYKPGPFEQIATDHLSLGRYRQALDGAFLKTFQATLRVSILGTFLCLIIAFPLAYWIATRVPNRWKGLLLGLVIVPFWTNFLVRTIGWRIILAPEGTLSLTLQDWGLHDGPLRILNTRAAVQLGVVYNYLPLMIFPLFVALDRVDDALREAAKDLGANRVRAFVQVTVPLAMPGIIAGLLLVFIPLSGDYITASVLGGAKGNMAGAMVAGQFLTAQNWALGSAMAVILIGFILGTIAVFSAVGLTARALVRRIRRIDLPVAAGAPA